MGIIDIILSGFILYGLIKGIWKGLFVELASLVSLILGIYIAIKFSSLTASFITEYVSWNTRYVEITAFAVTFIGVVAGVILLAKFFTKIADFASLGWLNRLAGGVFGILKMVIILSIMLHFFEKLNYNNFLVKHETTERSLLFHPILQVSGMVFPMVQGLFPEKTVD